METEAKFWGGQDHAIEIIQFWHTNSWVDYGQMNGTEECAQCFFLAAGGGGKTLSSVFHLSSGHAICFASRIALVARSVLLGDIREMNL